MTTKDLGMVTAYAYAVMGGYEGTEAEFEALLGNIATDLEEIENLTVIANTLPEGSSATASYADGVLTLGIPKGDTGATGAGATATVGTTTTGDPGTNASVTNSGTAKDAVFNFTIPRGDTGNGIESIYLTGTSGAVKTYTILFTDGNTTTFDVTDGEVTNASLAEVLEDYAKTDGAYESMTVGNAEQLISSVTVNDKVPYNFRTSGGSIDIGNREVDKLVGGTVAWNQQAPNTELTGIGSRASAFGTRIVKGHKYLFGAYLDVSETLTSNAFISPYGFDDGTATTFCLLSGRSKGDIYKIGISTASGVSDGTGLNTEGNFWFYMNAQTGSFKNLKLFDLTQMFGSTIADYIYTLEQANAGAGVAWFKKLFPKDYYEYNAGELISVSGLQSHDMVGFNQWDEEWENGYINVSDGENVANNSFIRGKNFIPVFPNTQYYSLAGDGSADMAILYYDANKNYLNSYVYRGNDPFTTPSNCHYIRFYMASGYGTTYNNDICINIAWDNSRNGEYEPYDKHSYPLDTDLTLRGIPKLDANNNLHYDGDEYESDGTVTRKYAIVDLGTPNWSTNRTNIFEATVTGLKYASYGVVPNILSSAYPTISARGGGDMPSASDKSITTNSGANVVYIKDTSYSDATAFKTAMSGVYLVYELATPTTETADPYQNPQIVDDFGTEEYVDERTVAIPVGHDTEYMNNLKAKLEMAPDSPDGDGDYVVRQTNGENSYVPLMKELPNVPSEDGTYTLKCTVSSGTATLGWESEE